MTTHEQLEKKRIEMLKHDRRDVESVGEHISNVMGR